MKMPAAIATLCAALFSGAVSANGASYTGNYPLTITGSRIWDGDYCLALNDNGSLGWSHSGKASLEGNEVLLTDGTFEVIYRTLLVSIRAPGGKNGHNSLVFVASSPKDNPGKGEYEEVYGKAFDTGTVMFGTKGSC
jgi:hypothetical protein